ncbi:arsenite efflux transporter metallochaperone ArsD [Cellulomonas soli]|uniref:Arsenic resistance operon repressor n=1 Tax=Cellulomonas soli TaxID=931535 RepID=A0A512PG80_9CELL|nr:arsenite efflux transporter metallochaperone ArsD [Cellulomonas soli]NYI58074.1 hypothetical protein [Cellulomonas soli]GEP70209.1 arsenic resistance operon repressor [Cellulomonas soli]
MGAIEVFEQAMCCSSGVCGPDVPQELVTFSADLDWLRDHGAEVTRHNLAGDPAAFVSRQPVLDFMRVSGSDGLPLVLVDGVVAMAGRYPSREELTRWSGAPADQPRTVPPVAHPLALPMAGTGDGGCCAGGGSC